MKTVKFKKWIITAVVSFIATILLLIISVIVGGFSMVHSISRMDSIMANNTMHNMADMMNFGDDFNVSVDFEYTGGFGCNETVSINDQDFNVYNSSCDDIDDSFENMIDTEVKAIITDNQITTKKQLDLVLKQVSDFISTNNLAYDQAVVDTVIDSVDDSIETKFDNTPLTKQMGNHSDFKDYFQSKCINGDEINTYIETYINSNII